jgi:hypothetical protein
VLPDTIKHRVAAVMIDNYPYDARPQSGLRDADIVYEVEAEGGVTRYLALYLESAPAKIGPVRSTRLYFVDLARPYHPLFAHSGENDNVWGPLKDLREEGFADMEEILIAGDAFWRDDARDMPHNLYTSIARLRATAPKHGWTDDPFERGGFSFEDTADAAAPSGAPGITLDLWNRYEVRYVYTGGAYQRYIGGVVQHDLENPTPYRIADVVAVWIPATVLDARGDLQMNVYGNFPALAMFAGQAIECTWVAPGPDTLPQIVDDAGAPIKLTPGQIYVEVLPQGGRVSVGKLTWSH